MCSYFRYFLCLNITWGQFSFTEDKRPGREHMKANPYLSVTDYMKAPACNGGRWKNLLIIGAHTLTKPGHTDKGESSCHHLSSV